MGTVVSLALGRMSWKPLDLHPQWLVDSRCTLSLVCQSSILAVTVPVQVVLDILQTLQVAAGGMHSVALASSHEIHSTGVNDEGALGRYTGKHVGLLMCCYTCKPS